MCMLKAQVVIVGSGASALNCALNLPRNMDILIVTKDTAERNDSFLAQGGICVLKDENDYDSFYEDTMRAGHYENNPESVDIMIRNSRDVINDLINWGVDFERDENGNLEYTREGAHSTERILFHEDITGKEITSTLLERVRELDNVRIIEHFAMIDIIERDNVCLGIVGVDCDGKLEVIRADCTVFATGGIGGLYKDSTNYRHLTGDAQAIAIEHGIKLQDMDYVQIHPTAFYSKEYGRRFLISESCRGEGGLLKNSKMERFVEELLPRDVVANAIFAEMEKEGSEHVWLDLTPIGEEEIRSHFPNIYEKCLKHGYDIKKEPIPITPAQHYFMGGIWVDMDSKTSMDNLYAVGETACNGVHGKNRLASNSLLEAIVFAKRAAKDIIEKYDYYKENAKVKGEEVDFEEVLENKKYTDLDKLKERYKKSVLDEIEKERRNRE
ncbi:MAG: L-aspartate oxidase [Clostridia bacterium]|nr:L-aspartate oxidase [Clostridia bacterium]